MEKTMKFLVLFLMMLPILAHADMAGIDVGAGQGTKPFYGLDYEFNKGLPYLDVALYANDEYAQPYVSGGLQFDHVNIGLAAATTLSNLSNGGFTGQLSVGPEIGYMQNLSKEVYIKENNSYMGFSGAYNFSATISLGFNL